MIAIYGGSFDPVHIGHLSVIDQLSYLNMIKELHIVPSYKHASKNNLSCFDKRIKWLEDVIKDYKREKVISYEIKISSVEKVIFDGESPVYTIDLLNHYKSIYPNEEIAFITGNDNDILSYKESKYIVDNFKVIKANILFDIHSSSIRNASYDQMIDNVPPSILDDVYCFYKKIKR